jgi:hypothetical protein
MTMCCVLSGRENKKHWMLFSADTRATAGDAVEENTNKIFYPNSSVKVSYAGCLGTAYEGYMNFMKNSSDELKSFGPEKIADGLYDEFNKLMDKRFKDKPKAINRSPTHVAIGGYSSDGLPEIYSIFCDNRGGVDKIRSPSPYMSIGSGYQKAKDIISRWVFAFNPNYTIPSSCINMPISEGVRCLTSAHMAVPTGQPSVGPHFQISGLTIDSDGLKDYSVVNVPFAEVQEEMNDFLNLFILRRREPEMAKQLMKNARKWVKEEHEKKNGNGKKEDVPGYQ